MIRLNYRKRKLGPKEREYMLGTVYVDGVPFTDPWLVRTGKNGIVKRDAKDADGNYILNGAGDGIISVSYRGRVKVRRAQS